MHCSFDINSLEQETKLRILPARFIPLNFHVIYRFLGNHCQCSTWRETSTGLNGKRYRKRNVLSRSHRNWGSHHWLASWLRSQFF